MLQTAPPGTETPSPASSGAPPASAPKPRLGWRRALAWALEIGLIGSSAMVPWALGEGIRQLWPGDPVPVNPVVMTTQRAIARTLGLPRRQLITQVPPLTNLLWFSAVGLPLVVAGVQGYELRRSGQTWPKRWLGLQVVTLEGQLPSLWTLGQREVLGRWGLPLLAAYGLWIGSGAYPRPLILGVLSLAALAGEGLTAQTNRPRRALHDYLGRTQVILSSGAQLPVKYRPAQRPPAAAGQGLDLVHEVGGLTTVILTPDTYRPNRIGDWIQHYPMALAGGVLLGSLGIVVTGLVTAQVYAQQQQTQRAYRQQDNDLFLALVARLGNQGANPAERQAAAIALGSTQDPRAIPLLVDLLAQTDDPALLDSLQQSLLTLGPDTLPPLRSLNQKLANDIASLPTSEQGVYRLRQRTVKRTLAKLLRLHSGRWHPVDLSATDLGQIFDPPDVYHLVLQQQHLAGARWQDAVLSGADFTRSHFFDPGPDQRPDTYDDLITDFSRSDLTEAKFTQADIRGANFTRASLLRADLSQAEARYGVFRGTNLSSAHLIEADLTSAWLEDASLVGADLTGARLTQARLQEARLSQATGVGAQLSAATLSQVDATDSDFSHANFRQARLEAANFQNSRLQGADFTGANLQHASFQGADLIGVQFQGANLAGANFAEARFVHPAAANPASFIAPVDTVQQGQQFAGVDFSRARNLSPDQIAYICAQGGVYPHCPPPPAP